MTTPRLARATSPAAAPYGWWRDIVRPVRGHADLERVYRLRYDVYVSEFGKPYPDADHDGRRLVDALDDHSAILLAERGPDVIGTIRATLASAPGFAATFGECLGLDRLPVSDLAQIACGGRLAVDAKFRGTSRVGVALMTAMFDWGCAQSAAVCVCHTAERLVPLMERFGWTRHGESFSHADSGSLQAPMVLFPADLDRLRRIDSPFWPVVARHAVRTTPGGVDQTHALG